MKIIINKIATILLLISSFLLVANVPSAQQLNKAQIKAAYLYNFLKHIHWPKEEEKQQFTLAVYQDNQFYLLLKKSFRNKKIKSKDIQIILINNLDRAKSSDLLYIPSKFNKKLAQIANKTRSSQTLLVTHNSPDKHNSMLNLVSNDDSAISFEVNKSNIIFEQLTTSAQLMLLGGTELDIAYLYRETEQAMQATRMREASLNAKLARQQAQLHQTSAKLITLNENLKRSSNEVKQQQIAVKKLLKKEQNKEHELAKILKQLSDANRNYLLQTQAIIEKKQQVAAKETENLKMASLIAQNTLILQQQQQNITSQQQDLDTQHGELIAQKQTIVNQKTTITITSILIFITAFTLILVIILFLKNKKTTQKLTDTLEYLEDTQSKLIKSEKMASLGKLIAGVAHEINTPLGVAITSTSLIQENTENLAKKLNDKILSHKQLQSYINIVTETSIISNRGLERVIELMHNFKEVSADQIIEKKRKIDIKDYINEVMSTLAGEMKKHRVSYHLNGDDNIKINTIPGALAQVLTNLVNNSIRHGFHSTPESKETNYRITINLEQNNIDEIRLTYHDNGIGMSEEVLAQVFDPFFTTKRNQGGTGLGMNIVFNIIEQKLSGHIEINSSLGQGVTCVITLPMLLTENS